jgi:hypothetical protein
MKEFKLANWPDLPPAYQRTAYRRMLSDMSHRYVALAELAERSGLSRFEVRQFVDMLDSRDAVIERDRHAPDSIFDTLRPLGGWLRRALTANA